MVKESKEDVIDEIFGTMAKAINSAKKKAGEEEKQ